MNSKTTIIGLVAAIAVLSGAMGLSVTSGGFGDAKIAQSTIPATGFLMGQVMIEAHNEDGELIAYRLGDNEVVDGGEQCILKMLFATSGGNTAAPQAGRGEYASTSKCTGILTGAWDVIAIGVGTIAIADAAAHDLYSGLEVECNTLINSGATTCLADAKLNRAIATTKTWTNGTGGTDTEIVLAKTFTSGTTASITESGLFNSTSIGSGGMLSHRTFAAVSLTDGDSITVTWTFTVGN
ncbi:hypothetical protein HX804_04765 [Marine Group I thaumarchaeote]|uniref:Uncharacterized protein n=1 Tax=Marine Group I thaumarchaeote TaxID=2511932 RepID=A0A7K4NPP8_9ARCH|nr:hypothetical protein [Marine Group I thaumarchaeote]